MTIDDLRAAIERVRELHQPTEGMGYYFDENRWDYGTIDSACTTCGTVNEYAIPYPCPTIRALDWGGSDD